MLFLVLLDDGRIFPCLIATLLMHGAGYVVPQLLLGEFGLLGVCDLAVLPTLDDGPFGRQPEIAGGVEHQNVELVAGTVQDDGGFFIDRRPLVGSEISIHFGVIHVTCNRCVRGESVIQMRMPVEILPDALLQLMKHGIHLFFRLDGVDGAFGFRKRWFNVSAQRL